MKAPLDSLSHDELIVLFEWLSENEEKEQVTISEISELIVLDRIHGILEKELAESFDSDWGDILGGAKFRIKKEFEDKMGTETWLHELSKKHNQQTK
ncbi:hypothetical protein QEH59_08710 [Coraliomargarita sp. SDUM461004]|uniref:Uncharacterized protein n=1 Tax=Thalassobacterium sedimentorum TaxID=3041258 RepID=A0ABU1AIB2_9BACT|nr:hypothetical protein [Coraliomargarita sp. SDUM461004]MDQ8194506.1 hypothetical protein [Coraliomargarita sp. SDUM461004]